MEGSSLSKVDTALSVTVNLLLFKGLSVEYIAVIIKNMTSKNTNHFLFFLNISKSLNLITIKIDNIKVNPILIHIPLLWHINKVI